MGTQLPLPKGTQPPISGRYLLYSNGWMDQDGTWCGGRPRHSGVVLDGDPAPLKGAWPQFSAHVYCGNGRPSQLLLSSCHYYINNRLFHKFFLLSSFTTVFTDLDRIYYADLFVTARSELRKVLFLAPSVCVFCSCMKYLGNHWTDLHQIHKEVVFGSSLRPVWRSSSKVKDQGYQGQKGICRPFRRSACGLCLVKHL